MATTGRKNPKWLWFLGLALFLATSCAIGAWYLWLVYKDSYHNSRNWPSVGRFSALDDHTRRLIKDTLAARNIACVTYGSVYYCIKVPPSRAEEAFRLLRDDPSLKGKLKLYPRSFPLRFNGLDSALECARFKCVTAVECVGGALTFNVTGNEPQIDWMLLQIPAETCPVLLIRMRTDVATGGKVHWITRTSPTRDFDEHRCISFVTIPDSRMRDIHVGVGRHPGWAGTITCLRISLEVGANRGMVAIGSVDARRTMPSTH